VEELTALHTIDVAMTSTLDLDKVLQTIYEQVREIMDIASFYIALYDEKGDEIHVSLMVDQGEYLQPFTSKVGENSGFAGWVVRSGQPLWIDDVEKERDELPVERVTIGRPMRSFMVLPLIVRDKVIGVISAQSPESCAFDEDDRQLFSGIAHQAAIAITNAQLYEEARRRLAEAMLVQEVVLAGASTLDFDLVLERTVKALCRALDIDYLGFLLPEEVDGAMVPHPSLIGFEDGTSRIPIEGSLVGRAYRTGRPALVREGMHESDYLDRSPEIRSALAVPVRVGDRIVAVLRGESTREGAFGEDEMRIFTTVAGQLGVTLENARLYQEMARYTHDLRMLADASAGMIGSLEPQEIADHLLAALIERFHAACDISLVELDGESIKLVAGWMPGDQPFPLPLGHQVRISEHGGLNHVMEAQQLVYIPDVEQSEWWALVSEQEREMVHTQGVRAILILPMLGQERLVGVVSLRFREPLPEPVDDQLDWAQTLVNQAAAALGNAQLYQKLETQAAELSRAYDELQEIDRMRTQLVQNVGHELRTPLSLIQGYVELLIAGDLGRVLESQQAALQIIRVRTATLSRLLHNLMMLQAVPREALVLVPVSVVDVVQHVLAEFRHSAEEGGIVLREDLPEGLPPTLGDQERLELVFGHLVDNAIKFSPGGGTVTLRAWADQDMVYVSVADEGIGIPPEHLGRVFERFYQVNGSTKRRFGGMGIGLALAWEIVEAHGGTLRVESEPEKGSTFTVVLPKADVA
jgi:signal transduction histidine kinase/putative methionine-R-sulfoxide reductase with GAF domain